MTMMETIELMKNELNQKIEQKKEQFNEELAQLNSLQDKIFAQ